MYCCCCWCSLPLNNYGMWKQVRDSKRPSDQTNEWKCVYLCVWWLSTALFIWMNTRTYKCTNDKNMGLRAFHGTRIQIIRWAYFRHISNAKTYIELTTRKHATNNHFIFILFIYLFYAKRYAKLCLTKLQALQHLSNVKIIAKIVVEKGVKCRIISINMDNFCNIISKSFRKWEVLIILKINKKSLINEFVLFI